MRDSFIFYRSFYEGIKELPRDVQGEVLTAIMEYSLNGVTTIQLKPIAKAMFILIKPQIDANTKRYENGKKGGRPSNKNNQNKTETKPNHNQKETKAKPNVNDNDNDNVNYNVLKKEINKEKNDFENENIDLLEKGKKEKEKKVAPKKEKDIHTSFAHLKITFSDYDKLLELGYSDAQIKNVFEKIENYNKNTNYKSLYLTAKNWLEKEIVQHNETRTNSTNKEQYRFSTSEAIKTITSGNK